jgi:methyl-accepting chemotaxis protein
MFNKLAGLSTRTKLTAIVVSLLVPVAVLFYFAIAGSLSTIRFARGEDFGNDWARPLVVVARNLAEHRDHVGRVAAGHVEEREEMLEHQGRVEEAVKALDEVARADQGGFDLYVDWGSLGKEVTEVVTADPQAEDSASAHNAVIDKVLQALHTITAQSGLALDPDANSYALISANIMQLPTGLDALAKTRRDFDLITAGDGSPKVRMGMGEQLGIASARLQVVFRDLVETYAEAAPEDTATIEAARSASTTFAVLLPKLRAVGGGAQLTAAESAEVSKITEELTESLAELQDKGTETLEGILNKRVRGEEIALITHVVVVLLALAVALVIVRWVTRYLSSQVGKANAVFAKMAQGQFDSEVGAQPGDELGVLLSSLDQMQTNLREKIEAERKVGLENARIRQSLDASSANVIVADDSHHIIYVNRAATQLMQASQQELRRAVPTFDASKIIGCSIDLFQKTADYRGSLLSTITQTHVAEQKLGGLTMRIVANPIVDAQGQRLGTVVEWVDRTQEVAVENEVQTIVAEALQGNLDRRISEEGKAGFFKMLSSGLNELVGNVGTVVSEVQSLVSAVNDGNLARRIRTEGQSGLMVKLGSGVNELTGNISTVVDQVQGLVAAANDGDLTHRIATVGQSGLLVKVATGINELTDGMSRIVSQVKIAASEVTRGADEISQGNVNLSQRTEEQASSLEETASSMEEMTSTVKQNAENAGQANQLALAAREQAEKGGAVVAKAVKAMTEINDASGKIANIIGVIDEIAFQTNLLALNAAVEAARAGEQGRGFAVVASEVRNLAGRSATAAKEIKALIQDSVVKVGEGSGLVTQSGATLEQIVGAVKKVTDIVAEIAAASQEQSAGIEQVNKAVMQLDELTQQNAALVEEASAASQAMAEQARTLNDSMARYQVEDGRLADALLHRPASVPPAVAAERRKPAVRAKAAAAPAAARVAPVAHAKSGGGDEAVWKEF